MSHDYDVQMASRRINLVGTHEIGVRLGDISRQRVYQITRKPSFPTPLANLAQGAVWLTSDVDAWIAEHRAPRDDTDEHQQN